MSFAQNLKMARQTLNYTQEKLAETLNVTRQSVSKWENDEGYPETEKLIMLVQCLGVSFDYLFSEELACNRICDR